MKWLTKITTAKAWDFMGFESLKNQQELSVVRICMEKTIMPVRENEANWMKAKKKTARS